MDQIRVGIVGMGNMGTSHADTLAQGKVKGAKLTAICDSFPGVLARHRDRYGEEVLRFTDLDSLLDSGAVDGVIVATPHLDHPAAAVRAFSRGLHVLIEKPAGVYTKQVREMNEAAAAAGAVFGIMLNQRLHPAYSKLRELVQAGELGELRRTNWAVTHWYRAQRYYDSAPWRGTWEGEGGGVLLNQALHQLDLWQWVTGLKPQRVRAFAQFGQRRDIQVEHDVTAYVEYNGGATGVFIASTTEAPGTNRLELSGTRGKAVVEEDRLTLWQLRQEEPEFNRTFTGGFGAPKSWRIDIPVGPCTRKQHGGLIQNWVDAVLTGSPLLAPGEDGLHAVTLVNAMLLSAWTDDWAVLPLDEEQYVSLLKQRMTQSSGQAEG
ncbi:gfo/Idh/MocA family oxidoreductase [Paenibacillus sambharensis]|uniref:Gfo/Idh/MocA family oxidoreductase n=1 Tax=Paenibacillus sambharensis TaxID=1803190 RepID=A0A2W1LFG2_9BACL|nr:Gfo/Idh/MocA family oxidoreductase [Paenibacillus sambharensis]PZD93772.1 gfo/Idh/MocA family oxidoreductase [Paenibacillus sambharensis]